MDPLQAKGARSRGVSASLPLQAALSAAALFFAQLDRVMLSGRRGGVLAHDGLHLENKLTSPNSTPRYTLRQPATGLQLFRTGTEPG